MPAERPERADRPEGPDGPERSGSPRIPGQSGRQGRARRRADEAATATALQERLHAADREIDAPPGLWDRVRAPAAVPAPAPPRRSGPRRFAVIAVAAALVAAVAVGTWWAVSGPTRSAPAPPAVSPSPSPSASSVAVRVHNAEKPCRGLRTLECALRIAKTPYGRYAAHGNSAGRAWHGDRLAARCVVTDGSLVKDEKGLTSTRWYRVAAPDGGTGWLPGVRTRNTAEVRHCTAAERPDRPN